MIGIDTNIIVRLLTNDDKKQAKQAAKIFENNTVFIPKSVLLETEWVLNYTYELNPDAIRVAFEKLLGLPQVTVEDPDCITQTLEWYSLGFDFADALHLASSPGIKSFATFDNKFAVRCRKHSIKVLTKI